jgi:leucyl-tRNA synthetase
LEGIPRFLNRAWSLVVEDEPEGPRTGDEAALRRLTHQTIRKVTEDLSSFSFNTAVASLMSFVNGLSRAREGACGSTAWREGVRTLVLLMAPLAPHLSEELWERLGGAGSVHVQAWPAWDTDLARPDTIEMPVQINGKVRAKFDVAVDASREEVERLALEQENVQRHMEGKRPRKIIVVPNRLVNIVA